MIRGKIDKHQEGLLEHKHRSFVSKANSTLGSNLFAQPSLAMNYEVIGPPHFIQALKICPEVRRAGMRYYHERAIRHYDIGSVSFI